MDPLKWVFHLRLSRHIRKEEVPLLRSLLKEWCEANDAVYQKSEWGRWDFKAMIIIKGLGPIRENDPFSS